MTASIKDVWSQWYESRYDTGTNQNLDQLDFKITQSKEKVYV